MVKSYRSQPVMKDYEPTLLSEYGFVKDGASSYLMKRRSVGDMKEYYNELTNGLNITAITITLKPLLKLFEELEIRKLIYKALIMCDIEKFILYPDIDIAGNFHYHGVIVIPMRMRSKFKRYFTLSIGFIKLQCLDDIEGWYKYMRKDIGFKSREHSIALKEPIFEDPLVSLYGLCQ